MKSRQMSDVPFLKIWLPYNPPIGNIYHLYTKYIAYWVIIYHLPPIKGTRKQPLTSTVPSPTFPGDRLLLYLLNERLPDYILHQPEMILNLGCRCVPERAVERFSNMYIYIPIGSMYGIFTYIWLIFILNVGKCTIHGSYGYI